MARTPSKTAKSPTTALTPNTAKPATGVDLLRLLCTTPGVPGRERRIRELIQQQSADVFDEFHTDVMGSLHAVKHPTAGKSKAKNPTKVMLAAHMDQIGFLVRQIDDKGFLRVTPVGGFDTRNLFARMVSVCPDLSDPSKDLPGVMNPAGKPVHIASEEDKKKIPDVHEFAVDLGLGAEQVKRRVKIGDMVVMRAPVTEVGDVVAGQCMDNRVSCWAAIEAVRKLTSHACEVHAVFTVQEEVGLRGAGPATFRVEPDVVIVLDTTLACDTPGVSETDRVSTQGAGVGLSVMDGTAINDLGLLEELESLATRRNIKAQRTILHRGGTDAGAVQRVRLGHRVMTLLTPTRYIHTVTETVHKVDMDAARDLLAAYLGGVK